MPELIRSGTVTSYYKTACWTCFSGHDVRVVFNLALRWDVWQANGASL